MGHHLLGRNGPGRDRMLKPMIFEKNFHVKRPVVKLLKMGRRFLNGTLSGLSIK